MRRCRPASEAGPSGVQASGQPGGLSPPPREARPRPGEGSCATVPASTLQTRQSRVRAEAGARGPVTWMHLVNHRRRGNGPQAKDAPR